jgi:hypothetical protein
MFKHSMNIAFAPEGEPAGGGDVAAAAAAAAAASAGAWHAGLDAETLGYAQNRGLTDKTPAEAFAAAAKAHREAEKFVGAPADQILRLPKDAADEAGYKALYSRLGVPDSADKYDLTAVKFSDGTDVDPAFSDFVKTTALARNLTQSQAQALAGDFVKFLEGNDQKEIAEAEAKIFGERALLDKEWGVNKEANLFIAKQAVQKLGINPEAVAALEGKVGYADVMKMFQKIGVAMGEDKFIANGNPKIGGSLTREQAVDQKAALMSDSAWVARYMNGDREANREMQSLLVLITGESGNDYQAA